MSDFSNSITVLAAQTPDKPNTPTTSRLLDNVVIDWEAPNDNGSPIEKYTIQILTSDKLSFATDSNCNGSSPVVINAT